MNSLGDIELLEFAVHPRGVTKLLAIGRVELGCDRIERVFFLTSTNADSRGAHAHKICTQWFTILSGKSSLTVSDAKSTRTLELDMPGKVIKIPSGLWVDVNILESSIIAVFADQIYDEGDYIRDWDEFVSFREKS